MGGHADGESPHLPDEVHEVTRVRKLGINEGGVIGHVTSERHHVLHAGVAVPLEHVAHLRPRVADANEVRHRRQSVFALDGGNQIKRALTRFDATAVCH